MRLLYVCSDFGVPLSGTKGAAVHLRAITRGLAELGHEVLLLSPREGPDEPTSSGSSASDGGHPAHRLLPAGCPPARETSRLLKPWLLERGLGDAVARELRALMYNAWVRDRAVQALHDDPPDAIVERLSLFGHVGIDLADALNVPLILEVNAPLSQEARAFRALQLQDLAETIERRVLARADAIVTVSATLADALEAQGVARNKMRVVLNGVNPGEFEGLPSREVCRAELGFTSHSGRVNGRPRFVVGFAGSLKPWHGVDLLLSAFAERFKDDASTCLLIVGTGPQEQTLRERARALGMVDRVLFTGAVPHARVPALLRAMDVAVAPFAKLDNFYFSPIKLFEYMAAEACVVASQLGQIEEVIRDGVSGLLFPAGDVGKLGDALELARASRALRARLGLAARQTVHEYYTWAHAAETTLKVIEQAIERAGEVKQPPGVDGPCRPTEVLS